MKISRDKHTSCHFLLHTQKGTTITLLAAILYYSTLSGPNQQILTPKRYDEHPRPFYRGPCPPGVTRESELYRHGRLINRELVNLLVVAKLKKKLNEKIIIIFKNYRIIHLKNRSLPIFEVLAKLSLRH